MNYTLYMQNNTRVTVNYLLRNVVNLLCVVTTSSKLLTRDKQVDVAKLLLIRKGHVQPNNAIFKSYLFQLNFYLTSLESSCIIV